MDGVGVRLVETNLFPTLQHPCSCAPFADVRHQGACSSLSLRNSISTCESLRCCLLLGVLERGRSFPASGPCQGTRSGKGKRARVTNHSAPSRLASSAAPLQSHFIPLFLCRKVFSPSREGTRAVFIVPRLVDSDFCKDRAKEVATWRPRAIFLFRPFFPLS